MSLRMSGSQTVGPYFQIGFSWLYRTDIGAEARGGERVRVRGFVYDGAGAPVSDALIEIWQADTQGRYATDPEGQAIAEAEFMGFGRVPLDKSGGYEFRTVKPGPVRQAGGQRQAPHLSIALFMRGLLMPVRTRLYFPDEPSNADDPVLSSVPKARRATLMARKGPENVLEWDVHMQGPNETVFFSY